MDQKAIMQLLENMYKSADDMLFMADKKYAEANNPESNNYLIRDLYYEHLRFFKGYKQGIANVLNNIRTYYYEEAGRMSKVSELLKHVEVQTRMANEHRSLEIERGGYATTIEYWRGRENAWIDAADLIRHYLGGDENESEVQP